MEGAGNLTLGSKEDLAWAPHLWWQCCWKGRGHPQVHAQSSVVSNSFWSMDCNPARPLSMGFPSQGCRRGRCSAQVLSCSPPRRSGNWECTQAICPQSSVTSSRHSPIAPKERLVSAPTISGPCSMGPTEKLSWKERRLGAILPFILICSWKMQRKPALPISLQGSQNRRWSKRQPHPCKWDEEVKKNRLSF